MVTPSQKKQAISYLAQLLEESGLYNLHTHTDRSLLLHERGWVAEVPKTCEVVIANFYTPIDQFTTQYNRNRQHQPQPIYTIPVFYKDGKTAFVRLAENQSWRADQSLKKYPPQQINQILHLRGIEKAVLEMNGYPNLCGTTALYYQPQTEQLEESLRVFQLQPIDLDYSHIPHDDPRSRFAQNRQSVDYKLPLDQGKIEPAAKADILNNSSYHKLARIVSTEKKPRPTLPDLGTVIDAFLNNLSSPSTADEQARVELQHAAQKAYPHIEDPQEALHIYLGGKV